jgi:RNA binding exosome subunit
VSCNWSPININNVKKSKSWSPNSVHYLKIDKQNDMNNEICISQSGQHIKIIRVK